MVRNGQTPLKWTRASGWGEWSATASGGAVRLFKGITKFKSRLFAWEDDSQKFWYSSADQILGTFNSFDISDLINSPIQTTVTMPRDGGAGPDDYIAFISKRGETVVYAGTDPAAADSWSLVGVYRIGAPMGVNSHINYGQQTVVLCEDDFYFLPQDLNGKRQPTKGVTDRARENEFVGSQINACYHPQENLLVFSDGSVLNGAQNLAYSNIYLNNSTPDTMRRAAVPNSASNISNAAQVASWRGRLYSYSYEFANSSVDTGYNAVFELNYKPNAGKGAVHAARLRTAPIKVDGRAVIHMVNPVFAARPDRSNNPINTADIPTKLGVKYRTAVVYDTAYDPYASASANAWTTVSASANTVGCWTNGYGYGDAAQIFIDVMTATCSGELFLERIDITASDTGGI